MREVVLDTETTGFDPEGGDRIVEIGAVELLNHLPTGRTYHQYINPERAMPADAFEVHGLGDEFLRDKPVFAKIGQAFLEFIGAAQLVIHNAAFDMKFLKVKEAECGATFDNPVLDTLLLSVFLHDHTPQHTLDAVAGRFGVPVRGRHTALGDSLVTAGVFLRMIDALEARGVRTLDQAVDAANKIVAVRARQAKF